MVSSSNTARSAFRQSRILCLGVVLILAACAPNTDGSGDEDAGAGPDAQTTVVDAAPRADADPGAWVQILSPIGGAELDNPVELQFTTGESVAYVSFSSEGWSLHDDLLPAAQSPFTHTFEGVGYVRTVRLTGFAEDQQTAIASAEVQFTVLGEPPPSMVFPLAMEPGLYLSAWEGPNSGSTFGASRDSGNRLHAGCDLYWTPNSENSYYCSFWALNENIPIYAVTDGIIKRYASFYQTTWALEVNHGDFTVRYGEVLGGGLPGGLQVDDTVTAGQHIANMGNLVDAGSCTWSMLHFEVYSNDLTGSLTNTSTTTYLNVPDGPYNRRGDLMNCVPFLQDLLP
jgi:Peptidase family M23